MENEKYKKLPSVEEILADLRARSKEITPEAEARIKEQVRQRDEIQALRREQRCAILLADSIYGKLREEFEHGGVVNKNNDAQRKFKEAIRAERPIEFVLFIGAGDKYPLDGLDRNFIQDMRSTLEIVTNNYGQGVKLHVISADEHVMRNGYIVKSNGELIQNAEHYFEDMEKGLGALQQDGNDIQVESIRLSKLYKMYGLSHMTEERAIQDSTARDVFGKYKKPLLRNAIQHSITGADPETDAIRYVAMRRQERIILENEFPHAVLLATGRSTGAEEMILPEKYGALFSGKLSPWFVKGGE